MAASCSAERAPCLYWSQYPYRRLEAALAFLFWYLSWNKHNIKTMLYTGRFKINRTHTVFPLKSVHSIYMKLSGNHNPSMHGLSYQFHHHIFKIVEMRAVWKKVGKAWNHVLIDKKYTFFKVKFFMKFLNISNTNWDTIKYHSFKEAEIPGVLFDTRVE